VTICAASGPRSIEGEYDVALAAGRDAPDTDRP